MRCIPSARLVRAWTGSMNVLLIFVSRHFVTCPLVSGVVSLSPVCQLNKLHKGRCKTSPMHYNKHMSNQPTMFNFTHSTALKSFILDMGEADLEMCCDFIESQGVELTPKVIDQISDILEFTVA